MVNYLSDTVNSARKKVIAFALAMTFVFLITHYKND